MTISIFCLVIAFIVAVVKVANFVIARRRDSELANKHKRAYVTASLEKFGETDYRFVIMNQGPSIASNVIFGIDPNDCLDVKECKRKLPYPCLQPDQDFTLHALLNFTSAWSYQSHLKWNNPDGSLETKEIYLST